MDTKPERLLSTRNGAKIAAAVPEFRVGTLNIDKVLLLIYRLLLPNEYEHNI